MTKENKEMLLRIFEDAEKYGDTVTWSGKVEIVDGREYLSGITIQGKGGILNPQLDADEPLRDVNIKYS